MSLMSRQSKRGSGKKLARALMLSAALCCSIALSNQAIAGTVTYAYDALGRVITVNHSDGSTVNYQYDKAGNRTQVVKTVPVSAPTVGAVSLTTAFNTTGTATLTPSGSYTSLTKATNPLHGTASISGTTATFIPTTGYSGTDSFTYTATGPGGTSAPATVSVNVIAATPTVGAVSLSTAFNTTGTVALTPTGSYTSLAVATTPLHGTASISGTTATFIPTTGYSGTDSFTYTATGPGGTSAPATVSVNVIAAAPTVGAVSLSTAFNTTGSVALTPSGSYTSLTKATNPLHGTASISGTTATFIPTTGYSGADSFTYTATGPGGTSTPATVSITVAASVNHAPVCTDTSGSIGGPPAQYPMTITNFVTASSASSYCTDADGDAMTVTSPAMPFDLVMPTTDTYINTFTVSDGHGGTASFNITITRF